MIGVDRVLANGWISGHSTEEISRAAKCRNDTSKCASMCTHIEEQRSAVDSAGKEGPKA